MIKDFDFQINDWFQKVFVSKKKNLVYKSGRFKSALLKNKGCFGFQKENLYLKVSCFVLFCQRDFKIQSFSQNKVLFKKKQFSEKKRFSKECVISLQNSLCISNSLKTSHPLQNV
jgi:hypothetical protein